MGDSVTCSGCDKDRLQKIASTANCVVKDGKFACSSQGHCELGTPKQDCSTTHYACHIYSCDACSDPTLKAKCCESCLSSMCDASTQEVTLCQGCGEAPGASNKFFFR